MDRTRKIQIAALVVRLLANHTRVVRKPSEYDTFFNSLFGVKKSYDIQLAEDFVDVVDSVGDTIKTVRTNRKFKKIVQNY